MAMTATRGDVWLVDLGMIAKVRPCLVLSIPADDDNDRVLTTVVPHTTKYAKFTIRDTIERAVPQTRGI